MDVSQLTDFNPQRTGLDRAPLELLRYYEQQPPQPRIPCGEEEFLGLLAAVPTMRKVPGVAPLREDDPAIFTSMPVCPGPRAVRECRDHLANTMGITDRQTLVEFCNREICCQNHYIDFESFWEGRPLFDLGEMGDDKEREHFCLFRDFAAQFYPFLQRHGFLAWDISESVGYLRLARACELITQEEYLGLGSHWITQAQTFESWAEYAASLVSGQLYWNFIHGAGQQQLREGEELFMNLVQGLLADEKAWQTGRWYTPAQEKVFAIPAADIRPMLRQWEGPRGCFATDHITVLNTGVGFCYREKPENEEFPDSCWRFFSGQETQEYVDDFRNTSVFDLNTIVNYDPELLTILDAPYGSAFGRGEDGKFHPEPFKPQEE